MYANKLSLAKAFKLTPNLSLFRKSGIATVKPSQSIVKFNSSSFYSKTQLLPAFQPLKKFTNQFYSFSQSEKIEVTQEEAFYFNEHDRIVRLYEGGSLEAGEKETLLLNLGDYLVRLFKYKHLLKGWDILEDYLSKETRAISDSCLVDTIQFLVLYGHMPLVEGFWGEMLKEIINRQNMPELKFYIGVQMLSKLSSLQGDAVWQEVEGAVGGYPDYTQVFLYSILNSTDSENSASYKEKAAVILNSLSFSQLQTQNVGVIVEAVASLNLKLPKNKLEEISSVFADLKDKVQLEEYCSILVDLVRGDLLEPSEVIKTLALVNNEYFKVSSHQKLRFCKEFLSKLSANEVLFENYETNKHLLYNLPQFTHEIVNEFKNSVNPTEVDSYEEKSKLTLKFFIKNEGHFGINLNMVVDSDYNVKENYLAQMHSKENH